MKENSTINLFPKRQIKVAINNEIARLKSQAELLKKIGPTLESMSYKIAIPINKYSLKILFKTAEFRKKGVYAISLEKITDATILKKQLKNYRKKRKRTKENSFRKEAIVKYNDNYSNVLYVGKVKSMTFSRRLSQHLIGEHNSQTTAIRLNKWLNKSGQKISSKKFVITLIPLNNHAHIRVFEKAIWNYLKPIFGEL